MILQARQKGSDSLVFEDNDEGDVWDLEARVATQPVHLKGTSRRAHLSPTHVWGGNTCSQDCICRWSGFTCVGNCQTRPRCIAIPPNELPAMTADVQERADVKGALSTGDQDILSAYSSEQGALTSRVPSGPGVGNGASSRQLLRSSLIGEVSLRLGLL